MTKSDFQLAQNLSTVNSQGFDKFNIFQLKYFVDFKILYFIKVFK